MSFNLTAEPWIPVVTQDWQRRELSLIELFETWQSLREIQAENPPTTLALYRLLLAILHRAYQGPRDVDHWEEIQLDDGKQAIAYLQEQQDCFDLLHPERPFMQDVALTENLASQIYVLHKMQGDNTSTIFSHEHQWSGYDISLKEAACLLIRLQSVEITTPRANYPAPNVGAKNTKATPTINAANVLLRSDTLKATLFLNLMQYNSKKEIPSVFTGNDIPSWEVGYCGVPKKSALPCGYINYLTYPFRRLRLFLSNNRVVSIAITKGHEFPDEISLEQWECSIGFREGKPLRLIPSRKLWRDAHSFLMSIEKSHRPRIVDWVADLKREDLIENNIHFQIFGMCADKAKPEVWSIERFSVPTSYILNKRLAESLKSALDLAENHRRVFSGSGDSPYGVLAKALKNREVGRLANSLDGESRYWAALDREFQPFLSALANDMHSDANGTLYGNQALPKWLTTVQTAARDAFTESIASIRNYQARAAALRTLAWKLADLRASPEEKKAKKAKATAKKKQKVAK
jgi:CRISPR system Cascade subunit CasA